MNPLYSVGCLWRVTLPGFVRGLFSSSTEIEELTMKCRTKLSWKHMQDDMTLTGVKERVACVDSVVLVAACTYSGNKHEGKTFLKVFRLCTLN